MLRHNTGEFGVTALVEDEPFRAAIAITIMSDTLPATAVPKIPLKVTGSAYPCTEVTSCNGIKENKPQLTYPMNGEM